MPGETSVEVWLAPLDVPAPLLARLVATLTPAERARAARYRSPDDARRFSAARGWLRHVLAEASATAPGDVEFAAEPGKPRLAGETGVRFNLSHTEELAVIAVAECEVGVDVEHLGRGLRILDAASVACTPEEVAALRRLPPTPRAEAFLRLWTAKEAFLKATGEGLRVPPDRVRVTAPEGGAATPVHLADGGGPARWWVRELRPGPGYVGAVAAEGRDWQVELRTIEALGL